MKSQKPPNTFDEDHVSLTDILDTVAERNNESRKLINDHIHSLKGSGKAQESLEVETKINELIDEYMKANFVVGYIAGQTFDVTDSSDPEAIVLRKKLKSIYGFEKKGMSRQWTM